MRTALYRHFDAAGALLYVGVSLNSIQRTAQHRNGAKWFERIARITIAWHTTREAALTAEAIAIAAESPTWNRARPRVDVPLKRPRVGEGVRHVLSGRIDGWYFDGTAGHMLGWWRAVYPRDEFELAGPAPMDSYIHRPLRSTDSEEWATTEPEYAAGDAFDKAAA